mmetsp:Transcript_62850/g.130668  ORF Transcript_62850/g.130668 Transcript_62850/m.130668 type:complete len:110 (-) Transcript_62850:107-436(-)
MEATFTAELNNYKIVRLEDHYRLRLKQKHEAKPEVKQIAAAEKQTPAAAEKPKADEGTFWAQFENALQNVLDPAELSALIADMKKGVKDVPGSINLEELDAAAAMISAR